MYNDINLIATEALAYSKMESMKLYNLSRCQMPKSEKIGFGEAIFLLSKSQEDSLKLLQSAPFIDYINPRYKWYYIESHYREKIGKVKVIQNQISKRNKVFTQYKFTPPLKYIPHASKKNKLESTPNLFVDLGYWMTLYDQYTWKKTVKLMCQRYLSFLSLRLSEELFSKYNKTVIIDVNQYFHGKKLQVNMKNLDDPISILLFSIYRYPEFIDLIPQVDFLILDPIAKQFIKIKRNDLTKEKFAILKNRLSRMDKLKYIEDLDIENFKEEHENEDKQAISDKIKYNVKKSLIDDFNKIEIMEPIKMPIDKNHTKNITNINKSNSIQKHSQLGETNRLAKALNHDNPDIMDDIIENDPDYDKFNVDLDDPELNNEIEIEVDKYVEEWEKNNSKYDTEEEIIKEVKKKVYIAKFMPEKTPEEIKNIKKMEEMQLKVLQHERSYEDMQSKTIEVSDFSDYVNTFNINILKSRYVNFNKSYNEKKLSKDIDDAVSQLSRVQNNKIFIESKETIDSSDQLNLKKTMIYKLRDENNRKMTLKFDIPIIIDDTMMNLNGSKKVLGHQRVMKPIIHTSPDVVWIVSIYNKIQVVRKNQLELLSSTMKKFILNNDALFKVKMGNAFSLNKEYDTSLEFDTFAKNIYQFQIGDNIFMTDINKLYQILDEKGISYPTSDTTKEVRDVGFPIGYNKKSKMAIMLRKEDSYIQEIKARLTPEEQEMFAKTKFGKRLMYTKIKVMNKEIPLLLFILFCEGFSEIMKRANIEYKYVQKNELNDYDIFEYGRTELADGYLIWKRNPLRNSLLLNGFQYLPMNQFNYEELDSKDTYIALLTNFYEHANIAFDLEQFRDYMIDEVTKEILIDHGYPTNLVDLMILANEMLTTNDYIPENDMRNMRIRSNEIIVHHVYNEIANAYNKYRKSLTKKKPTPISMKQNIIISKLQQSPLMEDASVLNPILELEKNRAITYKGERGINLENSFMLDKRAYDESMLGCFSITTPGDGNVGIARQLTLEPMITSTRGYVQTGSKSKVDELTAANLLSPSDLLTPLTALHDDPTRTAIDSKNVVAV